MILLRTEEFDRLENSIKQNALRQLGFDPNFDCDPLNRRTGNVSASTNAALTVQILLSSQPVFI